MDRLATSPVNEIGRLRQAVIGAAVKQRDIGTIPGLQEYAEFFVSDAMAGPGGPLAEYGLVPDPELATVQAAVAEGATITMP